MALQLGTVGSWVKINFGTYSRIDLQGFAGPKYFNVVNIDKYNIIIGTPFMHKSKVMLDFERKCVIVNGKRMKGKVLDGDKADKIMRRYRLKKLEQPLQ